MDLRGFSSQNAGVIFEISEVINLVPLERVVFIIDDTADELFLREVLQQSWNRIKPTSPNRLSKSRSLQLFHLKGFSDRELKQFLHRLSIAANATLELQASA